MQYLPHLSTPQNVFTMGLPSMFGTATSHGPLTSLRSETDQEVKSDSAAPTADPMRPTHFFRLWRLSNQSGIPNCKAAKASKYIAAICLESGYKSKAPRSATHAVKVQLTVLFRERCAIEWAVRAGAVVVSAQSALVQL